MTGTCRIYILFIFIKRIAIFFYCSIFTFLFIYETWELILFYKALANPNYIPVYITVNYLLTLWLFKVGVLFYKLAIPKNMFVFVNMNNKEKNYFMFWWTWEIEHKMYCLLLTWVYCMCAIMKNNQHSNQTCIL